MVQLGWYRRRPTTGKRKKSTPNHDCAGWGWPSLSWIAPAYSGEEESHWLGYGIKKIRRESVEQGTKVAVFFQHWWMLTSWEPSSFARDYSQIGQTLVKEKKIKRKNLLCCGVLTCDVQLTGKTSIFIKTSKQFNHFLLENNAVNSLCNRVAAVHNLAYLSCAMRIKASISISSNCEWSAV